MHSDPPMLQDFRFALRSLRKSPLFTAIAMLSIALGIGANTAIFTLFDHVLLRLLPVKDPGELVYLKTGGPYAGRLANSNAFSYPQYRDIRDRNQVFSGVLSFFNVAASMRHGDQTERAAVTLSSGNYFEVLGVAAHAGRLLTAQDDVTPGGHPVAVLSYGYWQRRFGGNKAIVNDTIRLNGLPFTVIGIAEKRFHGLDRTLQSEVFVPMAMKPQMTPTLPKDLEDRRSWWLNIFARVKPGLTREQAQAGLAPTVRAIFADEVKTFGIDRPTFIKRYSEKPVTLAAGGQGRTESGEEASRPLLLLSAMVGIVLLIACANVANLLLARATARQREIAVRLALGAGRGDLIRQLMAESLLLSLGAGVAGILIAQWAVDGILKNIPAGTFLADLSVAPDLRVLGFACALSLLSACLFGLAPALQSTRPQLATTLKDQAQSAGTGGAQVRLRKSLVTAQVALSLLLLIAAGLFARSLFMLKHANPGFRTERVITFAVDPLLNGYQQPAMVKLYEQLQQRFQALPGVTGVGLAQATPLSGDNSIATVTIEGLQEKEGQDRNPHFNSVSPGFYQALGVPLIAGRDFTAKDALGAPRVAIVNQKFVDYFFKNENPLGRKFAYGDGKPEIEIVGVVGNTKYSGMAQEPPRQTYIPYMQDKDLGELTFFVRTTGDAAQLGGVLREEVRRADANLPVFRLRTMQRTIDDTHFVERIISALAAAAGFLATVLAAIGLYGVMAYSVARRTREIGVRMALGASRGTVLGMVLREVALLTGIGIAIALPAALFLTRYVKSLLYGISENDAVSLLAATLLLAGIALAAGYFPARRATKIDPMIALRYE